MEHVPSPRPLTHDLVRNVIEGLKASCDRVVVTKVENNTFYARLVLRQGDHVTEIDSRPSDAIAVALRLKAPIYVERAVLDAAAVQRPQELAGASRLGIKVQELTPGLARFFALDEVRGVLVRDVEPASPAALGGLAAGDIVLAVGGETVANIAGFFRLLGSGNPPVDLTVLRGGRRLKLALTARPPDSD
jgi:bifunctional DNase/RNase